MQKKLSSNRGEKHNPVQFFILFIVAIAVIAVIANFLTGQTFLDIRNIMVIVRGAIYPTFIAWGLCFLFAAGYFDLSIGSIVVLGSFGACAFGNLYGYPGVILGGLIVGTLLVFLNSVVFAYTKMPSWIASISLTLVYEAIAIFLRANPATRPYVDGQLNRAFVAIGDFPLNLIVTVVGFVIIYFLYNRTSIGLNIRAVGGNKDVSRALGVNTNKTLILAGLICGLIIGASAVIQESYNVRTPVMTAMSSLQLMFKPLAIALLAQTMQKRISIIIMVPFCSLIIYAIFNLLTFFHVPSGTLQDFCLCIFIIIFGLLGQRGVKEVVK